MSSAMMDMMFKDACMNLSNGIVNPLDKDILSYAPLPDSVIDPYITQEVDPLQTMNLTNNTLKVWIEESKKANYFTTHFVTLSRMIMNGVATMARGLVTLHLHGEDLDQAPLSIQDLIMISSYQFRKSYIGVLQTVKSKPEVSEHLLMNQLRWNNTLIKLFKTREKLDSGNRIQGLGNEEGRSKNEVQPVDMESSYASDDEKTLPEAEIKSIGEPNVSSLESDASPLTELSELPSLTALGAYGAIRPYSALTNKGNRKSMTGTRKSVVESQLSETGKSLGNGNHAVQSDSHNEKNLKDENEKQNDQQNSSEKNVQPEKMKESEKESTQKESDRRDDVKDILGETNKNTVPYQEKEISETEIREQGLRRKDSDERIHEQGSDREEVSCEETKRPEENSSFFNHNSSLDNNSSFPDRPPEYARILYRAFCRSSGNEDGSLDFTLDEIYQLLSDPEFCRYEPQLAADFRKALQATAP